MKNMKKKVMAMVLAAMTVVGASALAAAPSYNYSENGDFEAAVVDFVPQAENNDTHVGYSENGDYTAAVISDVPQSTVADRGVGYSENGDYQAARA